VWEVSNRRRGRGERLRRFTSLLLTWQGCTFIEGTRHTIALLGSRKTTIPRHPATEIKTKTLHTILRDLGLRK
jgi:hypothetical protein